jgi:4-hydroxy-2-oxoheptanedioate aldolase
MLRRQSNAESLRTRLATGRLVGTFVKLPAIEVIDILAGSGLDFALVDLEHSQLSEKEASMLVRHAHALRFPVVVRLAGPERGHVNRLLEAGAAGIQLSSVRKVGDVRDLVAATRFAPHGDRSVSLAHPVAEYGARPLADVVGAPHPLLVGQMETARTEEPLDEILAAGLDVAFIGVTDLEVDLGFDTERVTARIAEITAAAREAGIALGAFAPDPTAIPREARYVAVSSDVAVLRSAVGALASTAVATSLPGPAWSDRAVGGGNAAP